MKCMPVLAPIITVGLDSFQQSLQILTTFFKGVFKLILDRALRHFKEAFRFRLNLRVHHCATFRSIIRDRYLEWYWPFNYFPNPLRVRLICNLSLIHI